MPAPVNVRESAPEVESFGGSYIHPCQGAKFHSPMPLRVFESFCADEPVWLCPTCEDNLSVLLGLIYEALPEVLDWPIRRSFGNEIRAIATKVARG